MADSEPRLPAIAWFDEPDAIDQIDRRATDLDDRRVLRDWVRSGYTIVEGVIEPEAIDAMVADLDDMFVGDDRYPGLALHDVVFPDGHRPQCEQGDLLVLSDDDRLYARDHSNWRVHGFFQHSESADAVRNHPELRRLASLILGMPATANYSINFHNGSTQRLHQDSAVFHLGVPNLIVGAWIACEDIVEGSGPLVYYPGSHRREMFAGFESYPLTNLRTADGPTTATYQHEVDTAAEGYEEHEFLCRKGDVLLWHGMLIHGGSRIVRPELTRRSYVIHFIPDGADVADRVTGPTNW